MSDIALKQLAQDNLGFDINFLGDDFEADEGMRTAVIISLFTDRRVTPEELPPDENALKGCWMDDFEEEGDSIGSKLWLLRREKITPDLLKRMKQYAEEALAWFVKDKVAASVEVLVERIGLDQVGLETRIRRPDGKAVSFRFAVVWSHT